MFPNYTDLVGHKKKKKEIYICKKDKLINKYWE